MAAQPKRFEIKGIDGGTLHAGLATSYRRFVEGLAEANASLSGADLREAPLQHMRLDGMDFSGADMTGADLTGSSVCGARFEGATLRGVKADGLRARHARMRGADLSADGQGRSARLRGSDFTAADMRRTVLDEADLTGATLVAAKLASARARRTLFRSASLVNAEHALASYLSCDFAGADLRSDTGAPMASLPDRTAQATCLDNAYKGTLMDAGTPAFVRDRRAGKVMRLASLGVSAAAVAGLASLVPEGLADGMFEGVLGHGLVVIAAVKLVSFLREKIEDVTRERLGAAMMRAMRVGKAYLNGALRRGADVGHLVAASVNGPGLALVGAALEATGDPAGHGRRHVVLETLAGGAGIVFCDRRHLAEALRHLHVERTRGMHLERDLILVRASAGPEQEDAAPAPAVLRFAPGGGMAAAWLGRGRIRTASWDASGEVASASGFWGEPPSLNAAKASFEASLWSDHGLRRPYVTSSHQVSAGRDGSIQVINEQTGRLNNPWGPALITVDDHEVHYRDGVEAAASPAP